MWVSKMSSTIIINKSDIFFYLEEKNMLSWLKGMDKHDFTGKRAKEQWEAQELVRKRKKEQFQNGQAKIPKKDDETLEKPLETNED